MRGAASNRVIDLNTKVQQSVADEAFADGGAAVAST